MDYFYIGIDDTDSPDGMCTTYLASSILNEFERNAIEIEDFPRLIRLNPFAPFKTRGNGGVSFKLSLDQDIALAKEIVLDYVSRLSMFDCENTNPGVVFYKGEITPSMVDYSLKAIYSIISIEEAEEFAGEIGAEIHKFKKGRGIIGSSVYEMDKETFPETFENIDGKYLAIEPKTPCPVLYGIRANNPEVLKKAYDMVVPNENIADFQIFKTNQHTDMHIQDVDCIADMKQYSCYKIRGEVKDKPHVIEGGHMFFTLFDESSEIECAAYEPTKSFRKTVSKLAAGDIVELYGGIGRENTFNIEKFQVIELNDVVYKNPLCQCGKRMTSAGRNKGFKCKHCGKTIKSDDKIKEYVKRDLIAGRFYETPVSARRHLAKPLIRMNLD